MTLAKTSTRTIKAGKLICLLILLNLGLLIGQQPNLVQAADQAELLYLNGNQVIVVNADGSNRRTLATLSGELNSAVWSPDGSKIAYSSEESFYVVNRDGAGLKKVGNREGFTLAPKWSPDGTRLLVSNGDKLFIFNADGSGGKSVATPPQDFNGAYWSPDGQQILYAVNPNPPTATSNYFRRDLYVASADGSNSRKLFTFYGTLQGYWPDGKRVVYNELKEDDMPGLCTTGKLAVSNLDGSGKQNFGGDYCYGIQLDFSANADKVLIPGGLVSSPVIVSLSDPGTNARTLSGAGLVAWSNNPGKIITLTSAGGGSESVPFKLEELDLATNARRLILQTTPLKIFQGEASTVLGLQVDPSGYAVFKHMRGNIYVANLNNGQLKSFGEGSIVGWRPSSSSSSGGTTYGNILPDFYNVWKQSDLAVATGQSNRSWLWGPDAFATKTEEYKEAKGGQRQVQYFDKARMEINNPDGDRSSTYFVTNGLLPKELIGGYLQTGDNQSQPKAPAEVNVAGDPDGSITYAKLQGVVTLEPSKNTASNRVGQAVTSRIDRSGTVSEGSALPGVTLAQYISETGHNIPNVFVNYFKTLPQDWVFVMGFPISEPYITEITLSGKPTTALIQVYERRVLTYTPSNSEAFRVEQGNVGQHYYKWRYGG